MTVLFVIVIFTIARRGDTVVEILHSLRHELTSIAMASIAIVAGLFAGRIGSTSSSSLTLFILSLLLAGLAPCASASPAFSYSGSGIQLLSGDDQCITTGPGDYRNNEAATIIALKSGHALFTGSFRMESTSYDYLTVRGTRISGSSKPTSPLEFTQGESFTWRTDYSVVYVGFTLCMCSGPWKAIVGSTCITYTAASCPSNYWADTSGEGECVLCGANSYSAAGSPSIASCICDAGYFGANGVCMPEVGWFWNFALPGTSSRFAPEQLQGNTGSSCINARYVYIDGASAAGPLELGQVEAYTSSGTKQTIYSAYSSMSTTRSASHSILRCLDGLTSTYCATAGTSAGWWAKFDMYYTRSICELHLKSLSSGAIGAIISLRTSSNAVAWSHRIDYVSDASRSDEVIFDTSGGVVATLMPGARRTATGIVLDGSSGSIDLDLDHVMLGGAITIEMVLKFYSIGSWSALFSCGNPPSATTNEASGNDFLVSNKETTGRFSWRINQGASSKSAESATASVLRVGERNHVIATVEGNTMTAYLNGVKVAEETTGWEPSVMLRTQCAVGMRNSSSYFAGTVAYVKVLSGSMTHTGVIDATSCSPSFQGVLCILRSTTTSCTSTTSSGCCVGSASMLIVDGSAVSIAARAFKGCTQLREVDMSGALALTAIEASAFESCSGLITVRMPRENPAAGLLIKDRAFKNTGLGALAVELNGLDCATATAGSTDVFDFACAASDAVALVYHWQFACTLGAGQCTAQVDGTVGGIAATLEGGSVSRLATGARFDGTGGYGDLHLGNVAIGGTMTIELEVMWSSLESNTRVFDCGNGEQLDNIEIASHPSHLQVRVKRGHAWSPSVGIECATPLELLTWYHIVVTIGSSKTVLYINGEEKAKEDGDYRPIAVQRSRCYVGKSNFAADGNFKGDVSAIKLYSGVMTKEQVEAAFAASVVKSRPPIILPVATPNLHLFLHEQFGVSARRFKLSTDASGGIGWETVESFSSFSSSVDGSTRFVILEAQSPHRFKVSSTSGVGSGWTLLQDFYAYTTKRPGLVKFTISETVVDSSLLPPPTQIRVVSAGYTIGNKAEFYLNGVRLTNAKQNRGLNVVYLNENEDAMEGSEKFDTYANSNGDDAMLAYLTAIPTGRLVMISAMDEAANMCDWHCEEGLKLVGATLFPTIFRASYIVVGRKGGVLIVNQQNRNSMIDWSGSVPKASAVAGLIKRFKISSEGTGQKGTVGWSRIESFFALPLSTSSSVKQSWDFTRPDLESAISKTCDMRLPGSSIASYAVASGFAFPPSTFTIEGWVKVAQRSADTYLLTYATSSDPRCLAVTSEAVTTAKTWTHIAVVVRGALVTQYTNGILENSTTDARFCGGLSGTLALGQDQSVVGGGFVAAAAAAVSFDDLRVHSAALSRTAVQNIAKSRSVNSTVGDATRTSDGTWSGCSAATASIDSSTAWCGLTNGNYLQLDLGETPLLVSGVLTQGRGTLRQWVSAFRVETGISLLELTVRGEFYNVNFDETTTVATSFDVPVVARYVRITPLRWSQHNSMRADAVLVPNLVHRWSFCDVLSRGRDSVGSVNLQIHAATFGFGRNASIARGEGSVTHGKSGVTVDGGGQLNLGSLEALDGALSIEMVVQLDSVSGEGLTLFESRYVNHPVWGVGGKGGVSATIAVDATGEVSWSVDPPDVPQPCATPRASSASGVIRAGQRHHIVVTVGGPKRGYSCANPPTTRGNCINYYHCSSSAWTQCSCLQCTNYDHHPCFSARNKLMTIYVDGVRVAEQRNGAAPHRFYEVLRLRDGGYANQFKAMLGRPAGAHVDSGATRSTDALSSSVLRTADEHAHCDASSALIGSAKSFCASTNGANYLQLDLGSVQQVSGVVTQGANQNEWTTGINVMTGKSLDSMTHAGSWSSTNSDGTTAVRSFFAAGPRAARFIQITPTAWHTWASLRADAIVPSQQTSSKYSLFRVYSGAVSLEEVTAARSSLPPVLEHSFDFRAMSGTTVKDKMSDRLATMVNSVVSDRKASGVTLDGVNKHIELDLTTASTGGAMTIEGVFKFSAFNSDSRLFECGNSAADRFEVSNKAATGQLRWTTATGSTSYSGSTGDLVVGVRYHIVVAVVGTTLTSYINGILFATTTGVEPQALARSKCYIGKSTWDPSAGHFQGEVSWIKVYAFAMDQATVSTAYSAAFPVLELAWNFKGGAGNTITGSVGGANTELHGGAVRSTTGVVFDGVDDFAKVDLSTFVIGGPMTIEAVVKWNALTADAPIFDCGVVESADNSIVISNVATTGELDLSIHHESSQKNVRSGGNSDLVVGVRYHIIAIIAGSKMTTYINGVKKGESTTGWEITAMTRAKCFIGKNRAGTGFFRGEVSSLKVFSGAMSEKDVAKSYAEADRILEFSWDFKGALSRTVADSIGSKIADVGAKATLKITGVAMEGIGAGTAVSPYNGGSVALQLSTTVIGGPLTIEIVAKWNELTSSTIFECGNSAAATDTFGVALDGASGKLTWQIFQASVSKFIQSADKAIEAHVRYHIVATAVGSSMVVYLNGVKSFWTDSTGWEPKSLVRSTCTIGKNNAGTTHPYMTGEISSLKIHSGAMSQAEVVAAYKAAFPLLEYAWDFTNQNISTPLTFVDTIASIAAISANGAIHTASGVVLDGIDDHIKVNAQTIGGQLTIEVVGIWNAWNNDSAIFACGKDLLFSDDVRIGNEAANGTIAFTVQKTEASKVAANAAPNAVPLSLRVRRHIIATITSTDASIFINGIAATVPSATRRATVLENAPGIWGRWSGASWQMSTGTWKDISGNGRHATSTGSGTPQQKFQNGDHYLEGGTTSQITFPQNSIPSSAFTIFVVARYMPSSPSSSRKHIFDSPDETSWTFGFKDGKSGVAYSGGDWKTTDADQAPEGGWVVVGGRSVGQMFLVDGVDRSTKPLVPPTGPTGVSNELKLAINAGSTDARSEWQVRDVIVWDRSLSDVEMNGVSRVLMQSSVANWAPVALERTACYVGKSNSVGGKHFAGSISSLKVYSGAMDSVEVAEAYGTAMPRTIISAGCGAGDDECRVEGGVDLIVTGTDIHEITDPSNASVTIGGFGCSQLVVTATSATCKTPCLPHFDSDFEVALSIHAVANNTGSASATITVGDPTSVTPTLPTQTRTVGSILSVTSSLDQTDWLCWSSTSLTETITEATCAAAGTSIPVISLAKTGTSTQCGPVGSRTAKWTDASQAQIIVTACTVTGESITKVGGNSAIATLTSGASVVTTSTPTLSEETLNDGGVLAATANLAPKDWLCWTTATETAGAGAPVGKCGPVGRKAEGMPLLSIANSGQPQCGAAGVRTGKLSSDVNVKVTVIACTVTKSWLSGVMVRSARSYQMAPPLEFVCVDAPRVLAITPPEGAAAKEIVITGINFGPAAPSAEIRAMVGTGVFLKSSNCLGLVTLDKWTATQITLRNCATDGEKLDVIVVIGSKSSAVPSTVTFSVVTNPNTPKAIELTKVDLVVKPASGQALYNFEVAWKDSPTIAESCSTTTHPYQIWYMFAYSPTGAQPHWFMEDFESLTCGGVGIHKFQINDVPKGTIVHAKVCSGIELTCEDEETAEAAGLWTVVKAAQAASAPLQPTITSLTFLSVTPESDPLKVDLLMRISADFNGGAPATGTIQYTVAENVPITASGTTSSTTITITNGASATTTTPSLSDEITLSPGSTLSASGTLAQDDYLCWKSASNEPSVACAAVGTSPLPVLSSANTGLTQCGSQGSMSAIWKDTSETDVIVIACSSVASGTSASSVATITPGVLTTNQPKLSPSSQTLSTGSILTATVVLASGDWLCWSSAAASELLPALACKAAGSSSLPTVLTAGNVQCGAEGSHAATWSGASKVVVMACTNKKQAVLGQAPFASRLDSTGASSSSQLAVIEGVPIKAMHAFTVVTRSTVVDGIVGFIETLESSRSIVLPARFRKLGKPHSLTASFGVAVPGASTYSAVVGWLFADEEPGNAPLLGSHVVVRILDEALAAKISRPTNAIVLVRPRQADAAAYSDATKVISGTTTSFRIELLPLNTTACFVVRAENAIGAGQLSDNEICIDAQHRLRASCAAGTLLADVKIFNCMGCPFGKMSAASGALKCTKCEVGSYTAVKGATACLQCAKGLYLPKATDTECGRCEFGHFSGVGVSACTQCQSGMYTPAVGSTACTQCQSGMYLRGKLDARCTKCERGSFSGSRGATTCAACSTAGTYTPLSGATVCAVCADGFHAAMMNISNGIAECIKCPRSLGLACRFGVLEWKPKAWYDVQISTHEIDQSTRIFECLNSISCMFPDGDTSRVECNTKEGYYGPLCGACDRTRDFIRTGYGCYKCWNKRSSIIGTLVVIIGFIVIVAWITLVVDFDRPRDDWTSSVMKMLFSHLQMLGVLGIFKAKGTTLFNEVVNRPSEVVGGSLTSLMPIKCTLGSQGYGSFIVNMSLPFIVPIIALIFILPAKVVSYLKIKRQRAKNMTPPKYKSYLRIPRFCACFHCCRRPTTEMDKAKWAEEIDPQSRIVAVQVFALFTLFPTLVSSTAKMVNCSDPIDGKYYLLADLTVTCYVGWHLAYLTFAAIAFCTYCIGIPLVICSVTAWKFPMRCRRERKRHHEDNTLTDTDETDASERWWEKHRVVIGSGVLHPTRGKGTVVMISPNSDGKIHVEFEHEEVHRYVEKSWSKMKRIKGKSRSCCKTSTHEYHAPTFRCKRRTEADYDRRSVRVRFGFLFHGYELDGNIVVVAWEASVMMRKLFVTLAGASISDPYLQIIAALMILIVSFGAQAFFQPYEPLGLDVLDSLGIFCLLTTQILSVLFLYGESVEVLPFGISQKALEVFVTICLFFINFIAIASFLLTLMFLYFEFDWRALRCHKRYTMRLVTKIGTYEKQLLQKDGDTPIDGDPLVREYYWIHPTHGRPVEIAPTHISACDSGDEADVWLWFNAIGEAECASFETPRLLERLFSEEEPSPGEMICFLDPKVMGLSPLHYVPEDIGGLTLSCNKAKVRKRVEWEVNPNRRPSLSATKSSGIGQVVKRTNERRASLSPRAESMSPSRGSDEVVMHINQLAARQKRQIQEQVDADARRQQLRGADGIELQGISASPMRTDVPTKERRGSGEEAMRRRRLNKRSRLDKLQQQKAAAALDWRQHYSNSKGEPYWKHVRTGDFAWVAPPGVVLLPMRSIDEGMYTQQEFIEHYGGTDEWDACGDDELDAISAHGAPPPPPSSGHVGVRVTV